MARHRFWRLNVIAGNASETRLSIAKTIEMRESPGGPNVAVGGTPFGSPGYYTPVEGAAQAFDSDEGSFWQGGGSYSAVVHVGYDFGSTPRDIVEFRWLAWADYASRSPAVVAVEWSDDGQTWRLAWLVFTGDGSSWVTTPGKVFTKPTAGAKRYWQVLVTNTQIAGGHAAVSKVLFAGAEGAPLPAATPNAGPYYGGYVPANYADANPDSFFHSADQFDRRFGYDYGIGANVEVETVLMRARSDSYFTQAPVSGHVMFSSDGVNWLGSWSFELPATWFEGAYRIVRKRPSRSKKRKWRLRFTAQSQSFSDQMGVSLIEFKDGATVVSGFDKGAAEGSSSYSSGYVGEWALDDLNYTDWVSWSGGGLPTLVYESLAAFTPTTYTLSARASYPQESPTAWVLEAFDEYAGTWLTWDTRTAQTGWTGAEKREFAVTPPGPGPVANAKPRVMVS